MEKTNADLNTVATIGLDLAKHVFQVHAVDAAGRAVTNRALRRKDVLITEGNDMIPAIVRSALLPVVRRLNELDNEIRQSDQAIMALAKADETARRLMTLPG